MTTNIETTESKLEKLLERLFTLYSAEEEFQEFLQMEFAKGDRSLLLTIDHNPEIPNSKKTYFASKIEEGRLIRMKKEEVNSITVDCLMSVDTFIDILYGQDKYNRPFDLNWAWATGEIIYKGDNNYVHRVILTKMFERFRNLLNLKDVIRAI